jgi:hypothetical protein
LIQPGIAFRELSFPDAARESFKEALRIRSRPAELPSVTSSNVA